MTARILKVVAYLALLTPLVFSTETYFPFLFPKALFFMAVVEIGIAVLVVEMIRRRSFRLVGAVGGAYGLFIAALAIAGIFGADPARSFWSNEERMTGTFFLLHLVAFFCIARFAFPDAKSWRRPLGFSVIVTILVGIFGMLQVAAAARGHEWFGFSPGNRVAGTVDNPAFLAASAIVHAFLGAYLAVSTTSRRARILWGLSAGFLVITVYATRTRGALIGLALAALTISLIAVTPKLSFLFGKLSFNRPRLFLPAIGACVVAFVVLAVLLGPSAFERAELAGGTIATRVIVWKTALNAIRERPLLGWGPENFSIPFNKYYRPELLKYSYYETWFDRAHNIVLDTLIAGGIVALAAFGWLFFVAIRRLFPFRRAASFALLGGLAGYFFQNLFVFDSVVSGLAFVTLLITIETETGHLSVVPPKEKNQPAAAIAAAIVGILVAIFLHLPAYRADTAASYAALALGENAADGTARFKEVFSRRGVFYLTEPRKEIVLSAPAIIGNPSVAESVRAKLADVALGAGEALVREHPRDAYFWFLLGRLETARQNFTRAEEAFKQALELSPERQQTIYGYGRMLIIAGRATEAVPRYRRLAERTPEIAETRWQLGLILLAIDSKSIEGKKEIQRAVALGYQPKSSDEAGLIRDLTGHE